jgi:transposase
MRQPRGPKPKLIQLTERQRKILEQIVRRSKSAQCLVTRSTIILKANEGLNNQYIADDMGLHVQTPRKWRNRWAEAADQLGEIESDLDDKALMTRIKGILDDAPRSGVPPTFTAEQICQIVALACESPADSGRPITNWTHAELADETIKRNIVESISSRSVGRFLKGRQPETAPESLLAEQ